MKKYIQPSVEIVEIQSETLMDFLVTSTAANPGAALGNGRRSPFGGFGFGNPFPMNPFSMNPFEKNPFE